MGLVMEAGYYQINNTKKVLYWDGEKWMKPQKDTRGQYSGWISPLDKQPNLKEATPIEETEYKNMYK
jgi:hypothetical protein